MKTKSKWSKYIKSQSQSQSQYRAEMDEDSWNPPWDCDDDYTNTNYFDCASESMKVNVSSPFKTPFNETFQNTSAEEEKQMNSTKKQLHFDELETEMEEIHKDTNDESSQDLNKFAQHLTQKNKKKKKKKKRKKKLSQNDDSPIKNSLDDKTNEPDHNHTSLKSNHRSQSPDIFSSQPNGEILSPRKVKKEIMSENSDRSSQDGNLVIETESIPSGMIVLGPENFEEFPSTSVEATNSADESSADLNISNGVLSDQNSPKSKKKVGKKQRQTNKSAHKNDKSVVEEKENSEAKIQKNLKLNKQEGIKKSIKSEDDSCLRISHILPDINWYPEQSTHNRAKNQINYDLRTHYPLCVKAMNFMLQDDIPMPKLNTIRYSLSRHSLFKYPSSEEKEVLRQQFPNFKSGRFNDEEKEDIMIKLKQYFEEAEFSKDDQKAFINELETLPSCNGGARGPTSNNLTYIRLYFASHVAGASFLAYRLVFDIYNTIMSLLRSKFDDVLKSKDIKKEDNQDNTENKSQSTLTKDKEAGNESKGSASKNDKFSGRFQVQDSCELIRCIVIQLHSKGHPIEIDQLNAAKIDWKELEKLTFRTVKSMQRHFGLVIWPLLKEGPYIDQEEKTWQIDLMQILIDKKVTFVQDIDWKTIQAQRFPNNSTIQLRTFIANTLKKRIERMAKNEKKVPIYEILRPVLDRYITYKPKGAKPESSFVLKQNEINSVYEDLVHSLLYPTAKKSPVPKTEPSTDKTNENNNATGKRKAPPDDAHSHPKKGKKSKHSLYTEKINGPRNLTPSQPNKHKS